MIENILDQSVLKQGHEISFILGHKILSKTTQDWFELKGDVLSISDWEDLKDFCLQPNEKIQLETKGYVSGIYHSQKHSWKFSFIEKKDCFRAYLSNIKETNELNSGIENPHFWSAIKKEKGIFIIGGERRQGKSFLLSEIISQEQQSRLSLLGIHSVNQQQKWPTLDSVVHLGADSIDWDMNHPLYDGVERIVVDFNTIKNWKKWIEFAEQGQSVYISLSLDSVKTLLLKLASELDRSMYCRFITALNGAVIQKLAGANKTAVHEIFINREIEKNKLIQNFESNQNMTMKLSEISGETYQSLNQSIIQKLIRRKIDVKAAFAASDDPDQLDASLKKMGL